MDIALACSTFVPIMCVRKHSLFHHLVVVVFLLVMSILPMRVWAQGRELRFLTEHFSDSAVVAATQVSLITCEPFDRIYSLYGHTGLRIYDKATGLDLLANWGIFDMQQKMFAIRFALGLTDYSMDIEQWEDFCARYRWYGSGIYEQVLNLRNDEKQRLIFAVLENFKEENRHYRYNVFYDNCTTRVRDIIEQSIDGQIVYPRHKTNESFRELLHEWNASHLWARWGNDYLLGIKADRKTTPREAQFLPFNLSHDFANAEIRDSLSERRLVTDSLWATYSVYKPKELSFMDEFVLSPTGVSMAYVLIFVIVVMLERRRKKRLWQLDVAMLTITGVMGLLLFAMFFSQHPTVRLNAQILIFNPLSLVFLRPITRSLRRGEQSPYLLILAFLMGIGVVLGMTLQHFAEGVMTLALFLLLTYTRQAGKKKNEKKELKPV